MNWKWTLQSVFYFAAESSAIIETVASTLATSVRIICLVLTTQKYHDSRAVAVNQTWGRRCTKIIFASDHDDAKLGAIAVSESTSHDTVWAKVRAIFKHAYAQHLNDFDWFLKADDDTFIVMENLRLALSAFSPKTPLVMGRQLNRYTPQGYMQGGAYVLSRKALESFVASGLHNPELCRFYKDTGSEDVEIAHCLYSSGVRVADSRDCHEKQRFLPFLLESHLNDDFKTGKWKWIQTWDFHPIQLGLNCCSATAASFHYVTPQQMYTLEYLIYHLEVFGIGQHERIDKLKEDLVKNDYDLEGFGLSSSINSFMVNWRTTEGRKETTGVEKTCRP